MELTAKDIQEIENRRAHALEMARLNSELMKAHNIKTLGEWNKLMISIRKANKENN